MGRVGKLFEILELNNPNPKIELDYINEYTLLVAVILSAQSTDKGVNRATGPLFNIVKSPEQMVNLGEEGLKQYIKSIGLFNSKAKNIMEMSKKLIRDFDSKVPDNLEDLMSLAGVGRKTANVVLNSAFGKATIGIDTHVLRLSNRLGLCDTKNVLHAEEQLMHILPEKWARKANHLLVLHGRYVCTARNPKCNECKIRDYCNFYITSLTK
ncbi:Endonuclease III [Candidatus Cyrtobacter comes]|uniref:Endonuclease III n=1 Tax=Candidatus Cyrtobacter comes TaxID=675776 RepID=A0ABU5L8K5_9RICK|nr:endonuclease III [Candidatus Cyrtobacter comes]MDZ5762449.1 Endonuclease III [Candidatus Cyrtobacter comes]